MLETISIDVGSRYVGVCRWDGSALRVEKAPLPHVAARGDAVELVRDQWEGWLSRVGPVGPYQVVLRLPYGLADAGGVGSLVRGLGAKWVRIAPGGAERSPALGLVRQAVGQARGDSAVSGGCRFVEVGASRWHCGVMDARGVVVDHRDGALGELGSSAAERVIGVANGLRALRWVEGPLVAYGGVGPGIAAGAAERVGVDRVIVPDHAGALAAVGLLIADIELEVREALTPCVPEVRQLRQGFGRLMDRASHDVTMEGYDIDDTVSERFAVMGVEGEASVVVGCESMGDEGQLVELYLRAGGRGRPGGAAGPAPLVREIGLRVTISTPKPALPGQEWSISPEEGAIAGPAELRERHTTVVVPDGWHALRPGAGGVEIRKGG